MANFPKPPSVAVTTKQEPTKRPPKDEEESAAAKYLKKGVLPSDQSTTETQDQKNKGQKP